MDSGPSPPIIPEVRMLALKDAWQRGLDSYIAPLLQLAKTKSAERTPRIFPGRISLVFLSDGFWTADQQSVDVDIVENGLAGEVRGDIDAFVHDNLDLCH